MFRESEGVIIKLYKKQMPADPVSSKGGAQAWSIGEMLGRYEALEDKEPL